MIFSQAKLEKLLICCKPTIKLPQPCLSRFPPNITNEFLVLNKERWNNRNNFYILAMSQSSKVAQS